MKKQTVASRVRQYIAKHPNSTSANIARIFRIEDSSYVSKIRRGMVAQAKFIAKQDVAIAAIAQKAKPIHEPAPILAPAPVAVKAPLADGKRGPRARMFPCAAIQITPSNVKILYESIMANNSDEARALFKAKFGMPPIVCDGADKQEGGGHGYYVAKGTGMDDAKRMSVTVPASSFRPSGNNFAGTFKGWNVIASGNQACTIGQRTYPKDALVSLVFVSNKDKKAHKPKLKRLELVERSNISDISIMR